MRDPKLAIALAIHEGALRLIARGFSDGGAVQKSRQAMEKVLGEENTVKGLDTSLAAIEAEFANGRFYAGEVQR
jgi:hypothetical protein